ncbi:hypothetical protein L9F63_007672 [Diploptera punctata]|uniref:Cytochrome P450 n=1 Tax=Diploptera punctata TaxID=6984 RepID=A0AAD7Z848_DIPPU|nr:hypothetical protein L9F63_007672 [Diploptera punctata]
MRFKLRIIEKVPHILHEWWKMSLNFISCISNDFIESILAFSFKWTEFFVENMGYFRESINLTSLWWILPVTVLFIITFPLYYSRRTQNRLKRLTSNIPGPLTFPILGNIPTFAGCDLIEFFQKLVKLVNKYGSVVRFWMGDKLYVVITDSESIEKIFINKSLFKKNSSVSQMANGNGAVPDDDKWKIHRKIISSTFNSNVLEQFMENFIKNSFLLTENLKPIADERVTDIYSYFCSCALDIICETTMGTNVNAQMEDDPEYKTKLLQAIETLGETFKKPWMLNDWMHSRKQDFEKEREFAMKHLHRFVNKVIDDKLASKRNGVRKKDGSREQVEYVQWVRGRELSLLDLLIRDEQMKVDEIRDELSSLIVAGTKVIALTCSYVLSLLGVHQNIQDKVLEEQERIFEPDMGRPPTTSDVNAMKYLEQVLKETLRLYPPVPFLFRNIEEDMHLENGFTLPRGSYAVIFNFMTHRNPEYYPDPECFDPDRFSMDCPTVNRPYSYIPFGGGRRICVAYRYGMLEVKTLLSTTLRKYKITETMGGIERLEHSLQAGVVLKPATGFNVKMAPRPIKFIPSIFRE